MRRLHRWMILDSLGLARPGDQESPTLDDYFFANKRAEGVGRSCVEERLRVIHGPADGAGFLLVPPLGLT
jgi:hypothetical protein